MHRRPLVTAVLTAVLALATAPSASAYLYWTDNGPGLSSAGTTIARANLDASGVTAHLVSNATGPSGIVSDGTHIYWGNGTSIGRAVVDGSGANPAFIPGAVTGSGVYGIATDGAYLYWTDGSRYIGRANFDGSGQAAHFIDLGSNSYPLGIAVAGGTLYVGEFAQIVTVPAAGGSPMVLTGLSGQAVLGVAVAGGYVYFTENLLGSASPNGRIGRIPVGGLGLDESYVSGLQYPTAVATDGNELYWIDTTPGAIGRATIGAGGATGVQPNFITDAGGPDGLALDSAVDPTSTTITCNPFVVAVASVSACTAQVSDSASSSVPAGSVTFASPATSYFSGGNTCTLTPRPGGGASCTAAAAASVAGIQNLTAAYSGDAVHAPSSGAGSFCAGTTTTCGGGSGVGSGGGSGGSGAGGKPPACKVPKLIGKSLATARTLLSRAHCRLGKLIWPRIRKGRKLVVRSERPGAGRVLANGAKVELWLGPPAKRRRH